MDRIVDYLTSYTMGLQFDDLPQPVVHQAKRMMVDTLGCAVGGYDSQPSVIARQMAANVSCSQPATVLGSGQRTTPDMAAFANGVMIRYLDYNDGYSGKEAGHPSDAIAAILSPAEIAHVDGREVIAATVLAYEVFCRLCDVVSAKAGGFDHVALGVIAAGLGAAKAMGLSREQTAETVNLCVSANMALYQTRIGDVSMWKGCAFANASRNAIFAAQLAQRGLTGPSPIFEGPGGFFTAVSGGPFDLEPFASGDGAYKIMEASIKRFPVGLYAQTVAEAAMEVRGMLSNAEDIVEVNVQTFKAAVDVMAGDEEKWHPTNRETADHSMPYTVAVALMYGSVEHKHFGGEHLSNPRLMDLVKRVKIAVSEEANRRAPEAMLCNVEVVTTSGERHRSADIPYYRGHWKNPMSEVELEEKFRSLSSDHLTRGQMESILELLWNLEQVEDIGQVIDLVRW